MEKKLSWYDHININIYWLGLNIAISILTPLLLPYLVEQFAPGELKNTYYAYMRVSGLAVAMIIQPLAGMLSDRNTSRYGRRRPFIFWGTVFNALCMVIIGLSSSYAAMTAYTILVVGVILSQFASNIAHGALQGLIPDLVPENQRGRSSGVKAIMELLPGFLVIFVGPLVDQGRIWLVVAIVIASLLIPMALTLFFVKEEPLKQKPKESLREPTLRILALTLIFVLITQLVVWGLNVSGDWIIVQGLSLAAQIGIIGIIGLAGMSVAVIIGVYLGARVGIGAEAGKQKSFIWWIVNRLLFLAAVTSIKGFVQYFFSDVHNIENAATMTTVLLAVVSVFLIIAALIGGIWADKIGQKKIMIGAGILATLGTGMLIFAKGIPMIVVSGSIIGIAAGAWMATNWALGTKLAPSGEAGKYLGLSNLAGAGAGIVGQGIGGPLADFLNGLQPGLGYLVIFAIYGGLFALSSLVMVQIKETSL
jgi:MFS family permease